MHVLIESMSGFNKARKSGCGRETVWYTQSPMVVEQVRAISYPVVWLDDFLEDGVSDRIGLACYDAVNILAPTLDEMVRNAGLPESLYFLAGPLQQLLCSLVHRQAILIAWLAKTDGPHLAVGDPKLSPPDGSNINIDRFDNLFAVLASHLNSPRIDVMPLDSGDHRRLYKDLNKSGWMERVLSLCHLPLCQALYVLSKSIGYRNVVQIRDRRVLIRILHDNELIREMLAHLLLHSAGIRFESPLPFQPPDNVCPNGLPGESEIEAALGSAIRKQDFSCDLGSVSSIVAQRLASVSLYWRPYSIAAEKRVRSWLGEGRPQALLSNTLSGYPNAALGAAARRAGIPVVIAEHGVSGGLSYFHKPLLPYSEVSSCDMYLACTPNSVRFNDQEVSLRGRSVAVGLAKQTRTVPFRFIQRVLIRFKLKAKLNERVVMYVSYFTQNHLRFMPYFPEDREEHILERTMVQKVMPNVRGIPVIKFYNTRRHLDRHPFTGPFMAKYPVRTVQSGDFRFLRAGADLIILHSPLSTLGWAFGTNKPIFYLYQPQMKLLSHVEKALSESVFMFSTEDPTWDRKLLDALNRSGKDISEDWEAKSKDRKLFLEDCVYGPERPGYNAACALIEMARNRASAFVGK